MPGSDYGEAVSGVVNATDCVNHVQLSVSITACRFRPTTVDSLFNPLYNLPRRSRALTEGFDGQQYLTPRDISIDPHFQEFCISEN
jgi:hypothetical protein